MNFIVCSTKTNVFRVQLSQVQFSATVPDANITHIYWSGNFDNYRTIDSPRAPFHEVTAVFADYVASFVYETLVAAPELLVAKLFTIDVYAAGKEIEQIDPYIGQATVDLLTLAAGSRKVSLTVFLGDSVKGRISFDIVMADQVDAVLWMKELMVESIGQKTPNMAAVSVSWKPMGDGNDELSREEVLVDRVVDNTDHRKAVFHPPHPHHTPLTLNALYGGAGIAFRVKTGSACFESDFGHAAVIFCDALKDVVEHEQLVVMETDAQPTEAELSNQPAAPPVPNPAPDSQAPDLEIITAAASLVQTLRKRPTGRFEKAVDFQVQTSGGQDNTGELFRLTGRIWISKTPRFAQMSGGITVDGVVCGATPVFGAAIRPYFTDIGEDSGV